VQAQKPEKIIDSTAYYDDLFNSMEQFLDSLLAPHSFTAINVGVSSNYYNYTSTNSATVDVKKKITLSPSIGYFHKNGLGISVAANLVHDGQSLNAYQYAVTGSYDYIKNNLFATGIGYTLFFTKSNLSFYTSPLQNSISAYFLYRKLWFKPSVSASYGWGSRSSYEEREEKIISLRLREKGFTRINTQENINDFSVSASVKHDFYWLNVLNNKDYVRLTPQVTFSSGSQQFCMNQSSNTYGTTRLTSANVLYNSNEAFLDDKIYLQPLSLTASLKLQYSLGVFFVQPQLVEDYYIPAKQTNILLILNAGFVF